MTLSNDPIWENDDENMYADLVWALASWLVVYGQRGWQISPNQHNIAKSDKKYRQISGRKLNVIFFASIMEAKGSREVIVLLWICIKGRGQWVT